MKKEVVELIVTEYDPEDYPEDEQWLYQRGDPPTNLHWTSSSGDSMAGWYSGRDDERGFIYAYPALGTIHYITEDQITWIADGVRENFQTLEMRF